MSNTRTAGITIQTRRPAVDAAVELLSSMRFAISLLTMIAIASVIGTVMKQNEPMSNYVNQFGPFWFEVFNKVSLYAVYSAWWFLAIMGFLVVSTSLCIIRNAPKMMKDMRSWRDNVREQSLLNFHHKNAWQSPLPRAALAQQMAQRLGHAGYRARIVEKEHATLVAAKRGGGAKFGYIFAHSAIVVICIGGLLDSDMPIRFQEWFMGKTPFAGSGVIAEIPAQHRLGLGNPSYRANTAIPEGQASNTAVIPRADGVLIQDLPFTINLKKFNIEFYSTGMPRLFASEVDVRDHATGKTISAVIEVNKPLVYKGLAVYQSSFEDGGTKLKLKGYPMTGSSAASFELAGEVNASTPLAVDGQPAYTIEWTGFRPFNVENMASQDARGVAKGEKLEEGFARGLDKHMGSAAKNANNKDLKNVGPSVQYKLRDKTGQAREFQNYMQPVAIDGATVFLAGVRANPGDPFSYLRIPADDNHTVQEWMRLRAALNDPALRTAAAERYARRAMPANPASPASPPKGGAATEGTAGKGAGSDALRTQLAQSSARSLNMFAGAETAGKDGAEGGAVGGFVAISRFLEKIPPAEQEKAADIFMKILNGSMWELWQAAREKDGLPAVEGTEQHGRFLQLATNALSDSTFYGAPAYLQLDEFNEVKASVFQITKSPGQGVVYLGCLFLVLGVFAMFYIRERRLWVWIRDGDGSDGGNGGGSRGAHALMAMSTQRKTLDFDKEFAELKEKLPQSA